MITLNYQAHKMTVIPGVLEHARPYSFWPRCSRAPPPDSKLHDPGLELESLEGASGKDLATWD